jgi:hypothetical protein
MTGLWMSICDVQQRFLLISSDLRVHPMNHGCDFIVTNAKIMVDNLCH